MMNRFLLKVYQLTDNKKNIYFMGLLFALLITLKEVIQMSYNNFQIYSYGSFDFWSGINPYSDWNHLSLLGKPLDIFLYSPVFSILFTPFALLPGCLGVFCWNIFTYTLYYFAVFTLPDQYNLVKKKFIIFYSFLLLLNTLLSMQFNPVIAALFLFSFTLMEKNKGYWAVLLILLSGLTKVYGIFQIGMLLFYPKFWKNILFALFLGVAFVLLPIVKIPGDELVAYYQSWIKTVMSHSQMMHFEVIYRPVKILFHFKDQNVGVLSLVVLAVIYSLALLKHNLFKDSFLHRVQFLGILMIWVILFGISSERNTYLISMSGYALWYLSFQTTKIDKWLLWINFVLLEIVPIDIFCPKPIAIFLLDTLNLGIIVFAITWLFMVYKTFNSHINHSLRLTI